MSKAMSLKARIRNIAKLKRYLLKRWKQSQIIAGLLSIFQMFPVFFTTSKEVQNFKPCGINTVSSSHMLPTLSTTRLWMY